jgi:hypothetical protein
MRRTVELPLFSLVASYGLGNSFVFEPPAFFYMAIFIYRTNSGPTRLELKQFSILWRSVPGIVLSLSKGNYA